jgi:hypothetical protein
MIHGRNKTSLPLTLTDAFGRVRVSNPVTLFDSQQQYDTLANLFFYEKTVGSATITHLPNESSSNLNVTTASGDRAVRQSRQYIRYQPGKSQLVMMTNTFDSGQVNTEQYFGYGDDDNGFFIVEENGTVSLRKRTKITGSVVDTDTPQSGWNIDKLDGTGPSGLTLDATKAEIFYIDMEWLGVGDVVAGIVIGRTIYPVHQFRHANVLDSVYITTANLPVRWEIRNKAAVSSSKSMKSVCCTVISEGGFEETRGVPVCASNGITPIAVDGGTTPVPIIAIRPKETFNSIVNRGQIIPSGVSALAQTEIVHCTVLWNPTITGGSWVSAHADSIVEYNVTMTSISDGLPVNAFDVPAAQQGGGSPNNPGTDSTNLLGRLPLTLDIDGANPAALALTALEYTGAATVSGTIFWNETR